MPPVEVLPPTAVVPPVPCATPADAPVLEPPLPGVELELPQAESGNPTAARDANQKGRNRKVMAHLRARSGDIEQSARLLGDSTPFDTEQAPVRADT
jgi:hypothetical protein